MSVLDGTWQIRTPGELKAVLQEIRTAVRDGRLKQVPTGKLDDDPNETIDTLIENGWPDHIEMHFVDQKSGQRYRLTAETYHGRGGRWEPI